MSIKLPRLSLGVPIADPKTGLPTPAFIQWWDETALAVETQEAAQDASIAAIEAAQAAAAAAQATANAADAKADQALAGGGDMNAATSLQLSQPLDITITSSDVGGSVGADISISAHTRRYGNGASVAVNSYFASPDPYDLETHIYYDDPARAGGAVTYQFTPTEADAYSSLTNPDRHYVGFLILAADGGGPTTGIPGTRS